MAVNIADGDNTDVWIWDLARETPTQLTFDEGVDDFPLWTPDSARVVFSSSREGGGLLWKAADGTGQVEQLKDGLRPSRACRWVGYAFTDEELAECDTLWAHPYNPVRTSTDRTWPSKSAPGHTPRQDSSVKVAWARSIRPPIPSCASRWRLGSGPRRLPLIPTGWHVSGTTTASCHYYSTFTKSGMVY